jgi:hypothetical protein
MSDESLVTVATFANPFEAHLFRGLLEQEEITSFVFDEHSSMMTPVFMVRVVVKKSDADKAMEILNSLGE